MVTHRAGRAGRDVLDVQTLAAGAVLQGRAASGLETIVGYIAADLGPYSPITEPNVAIGITVRALCNAAIRSSDNTAATWCATSAGPSGVAEFARALGETTTRLDCSEPDHNGATPGDWRDTTTAENRGTTHQQGASRSRKPCSSGSPRP